MDGRVEKRINDRFYFVLDEVGGSSDIESDTVNEDESKSSTNVNGEVIEKADIADKNNELAATTEMALEGESATENNTAECEENKIINVSADYQNSDRLSSADSDINVCGTVSSLGSNDISEVTSNCHNSGVIDMDIDYSSDGIIESDIQSAPIIKITFRDEKIEKSYKSSLLKFLAQKVRPFTVVTNSQNNLEIEIYKEDSDKVTDNKVLDFHLDTTPSSDSRSHRVPHYGRNHDVLLSDVNSTKTPNFKNDTQTRACYNCQGNHSLRDCPRTRDMKKNHRRNRFQAANKLQKSRYHLDENQRFGNLVPGELSKKLRSALDLHKDQQPLFIYRMRVLGYPPAWLEEARVSHSGVAIYDKKGVPVLEEDEEEGEIIAEGAKDRFDISKIIEFPGFNVPLPKHMKEEGKLHFCPAMSEEQSKENLIRTLEPNAVQAYKKRTLTLQKYPTQEESSTTKNSKKRLSSPTIEEMEEKKRQLLLALDNEDAIPESKMAQDDNSTSCQEATDFEIKPETPVKDGRTVKYLDFGTPILKSISPFSKLPSREQFCVNVSDVINFENLPNSTGKYESMSHIISKIRDTVSRIQNE